jgi:sulfite exporter TauE/SafE
MFPDVTQGAWNALLAGIIVSPHCVGMCGPLFCSLMPKVSSAQAAQKESIQLAYHVGRVISYTSIGAAAGYLSLRVLRLFDWSASQYFPWALIALLLLVAFGIDKFFFKTGVLNHRLTSSWIAKIRKLPAFSSALAMGLLTPLLPCAPLYMVLWVAVISGSPFFGAQIMLGFSLGTIPLLWFSQTKFLSIQQKWKPGIIKWTQRGLAVFAAAVIAFRTLWIGDPGDGNACLIP